MPTSRLLAVLLLCCGLAWAADQPDTAVLPCGPGMPNCAPTKSERKQAHAAYERGIKLERGKQYENAVEELDDATRLDPQSFEYAMAYQIARQEAAAVHVSYGNQQAKSGHQIEAMAEYRAALQFDSDNEVAQQELKQATGQVRVEPPIKAQVVEDSPLIEVMPKRVRADFHYTGDSKALIAQVASAYGITAALDDSVQSKRVRFDITNVDFETAMSAVGDVTKTFWTPLDRQQVLVATNTPENHKQFDNLVMRTFYFPSLAQNTALNDVVNVIRVVLEAKFVVPSVQTGRIVVRAPKNVIDAATRLFTDYGENRPQVMLDFNVIEIKGTLMRNMGLHIPNEFNVYYIGGALAALSSVNINDLVNQLISGGGINQLGNQSIASLLAQITGQQSSSSIFSQPLATFGNGAGFTGVSADSLSATLSLNQSLVSTLEHATLRAGQGDTAKLHIGMRYPILNASFAPVFNAPAIARNLINNSLTAPVPSVSYEDLGLMISAKPTINLKGSVNLELEMQLRALAGPSLNGVPVISSREFKGSIGVLDGTTAVLAGSVSQSDIRSLNGIPGLGQVPGLNRVATTNSLEHDTDQLIIVITPYVIATPASASAEIWLTN